MKGTSLLAGLALAIAALPAAAADLSRPGALDRLKAERPAHYDAVVEIASAGERANCGKDDFEALKARFPIERMDCGFVTGNPPQRRMRFAIEGEDYTVTVRLADTAPKAIGR